jgi:hypothetical protein
LALRGGTLLLSALCLAGCATYSRDLERVRQHYGKSEFPAALALLRALGDDQAGLSARERVEYAYLRGMTDYRLAAASPEGPVRLEFRQYASQWLDRAAELDSVTSDALAPAQKERLAETRAELQGRKEEPGE